MKPSTRRQYEELVLRAVEHVRAALDEPLDLQQLGRQAALSPLHFHRIFRGLLGETPGELHRRLRLERAAYVLATSEHAVTRVAIEAGYDTHESFTRAFAAAYGLPPTEFRARAAGSCTLGGVASASAQPSRTGIHFSSDTSVRFTTEQTTMNVTVKPMAQKRVFAVPHRGPYNMISTAFTKLNEILSASPLDEKQKLEMVALQYDDPETTPAPELRADAGVVVSDDAKLPAGLHEVTIPAGRYAVSLHQGPYEQLGDAWGRFMGGWVVETGHQLGTGPSYERYLNTPMNAKPHELLTEMYISIGDERKSKDS